MKYVHCVILRTLCYFTCVITVCMNQKSFSKSLVTNPLRTVGLQRCVDVTLQDQFGLLKRRKEEETLF